MTDETEPHPIARASLYERMSNIARENGGSPTLIEAARAHLGTDEPRGSVEDAMMAGADLETGELPAREIIEATAIVADGSAFAPTAEQAEQPATIAAAPREEPSPAPDTINVSGPDAERIVEIVRDAGLGEAVVAPPERQTFNSAPPPPAQPEPSKQEVIEPERAADGRPAPFAARDAGQLINMLENGQLSADIINAMMALTQGMSEIAETTGKKQKGTLTIKINLATDDTGEAFFVHGEYAVRAPKIERRKTLLWQDEKGHLSPSQPRQRVMFGIEGVGGGPRQIRDATAERRPL